ncbi:hypothetical protein HBI42_088390 [Parastagonospora nodorum]|nr:hypothetical protein HBH95_083300 [Parastagonospora nodorum]KAH6220686.1 hypothetical protein HBI43_099810 [Parastagonospora nodorum]KAH6260639.1 hypothetical protein HBI42_088390 [Parastagonospora nodorum]KAH6525746.1 hypothetical protein HBI07_197700 [Parastagonospora nodorum]
MTFAEHNRSRSERVALPLRAAYQPTINNPREEHPHCISNTSQTSFKLGSIKD